jgi:exodeoxyribonuclease-3
VGSPFYEGKLAWLGRLHRWLVEECSPGDPLVVGGDFNVAPTDADVWDPAAAHGGTHVSTREREALQRLREWGLIDAFRLRRPERERFSWWDYRAGMFHRNEGMRIDLILVTRPLAERVVWAEVDREARKGKPTPSDHAPVVVDLDGPGKPFDAGWEAALARIAARRR